MLSIERFVYFKGQAHETRSRAGFGPFDREKRLGVTVVKFLKISKLLSECE